MTELSEQIFNYFRYLVVLLCSDGSELLLQENSAASRAPGRTSNTRKEVIVPVESSPSEAPAAACGPFVVLTGVLFVLQ